MRSGAQREATRIPDSFIDQLKERADIESIVGRRVQLKKAGASLVGLCPFHSEKSPSFSVSPQRGTYHCFGCGMHGSALSFVIEHDGLPFRDAVKELASEVGLALPMAMEAGSAPALDTRPMYEAMERASRYFRHVLKHSPPAIAYLKGRGLKGETLKRYLIGFAADEWRGLKEAFPDYERNSALLDAGLIREKAQEPDEGASAQRRNRYDTFRSRITFGVRDSRGRIVAFGGRTIGEGDPKYLNSPETPIFDKSSALFGLFEARESIRAKKEILIVEGYMDVVMLAQGGVGNAVASMGTAFTRFHLERALTQSERVVFAFDGDAAGQNAAWKALITCMGVIEDRHDIRFLLVPDGLDPDEFIQRDGREAFEALVAGAPGLSQFLITQLRQRNNGLSSAEDRARFAAQGAEIAGKLSYRNKLRRILLDQIAAVSRMPGAALRVLQSEERASRKQANAGRAQVWSALANAVAAAPGEALKQRKHIAPLLDAEDAQELALLEQLGSLGEGAADDEASPSIHLSRDILRSAVEMVCQHRETQARQELDRLLAHGEIEESDYLRQRMAISQG